MGYLPIFLYLTSFILLFLLVVNNSIKNKKIQFQKSLESLVEGLEEYSSNFTARERHPKIISLADAEQRYLHFKSSAVQSEEDNVPHLTPIKSLLIGVRQQRYWYNNMIKTKPYSFVAKIFGHHAV